MGNGAAFNKKKEPPVRREPLTLANDVFENTEAKERVSNAIKQVPPGSNMRWEKLLPIINREIEPSEAEPDPLRVAITKDTLLEVLQQMYRGVKFVSSDGLALSREYIPKLYDKHSLERGRRVSQKERKDKHLTDECFAYGELNEELFATIYLKVTSVYGTRPSGVFYDLGAGVGKLVYAAAFIGQFNKVVAVDAITALLERGSRRQRRWDLLSDNFTQQIREVMFSFIEDNFVLNGFWTPDASFILLHWTALSTEQQQAVAGLLSECAEGTQVISFTNPVPGTDFLVLVQDTCEVSWGKAEFFFQEKVTPAVPKKVASNANIR